MNRNEFNYREVMEFKLPVIDRVQFAEDLFNSLNDIFRLPVVERLVGNQLNQIITDVVYYKRTSLRFKNLPPKKYSRLWNAYCIAYWPTSSLGKSVVDQWGYIKYKDIGYQPQIIETAEDAYAASMRWANSEPHTYDNIVSTDWWNR